MSEVIGAGDFIPWEGGCMLIGRAVNVTPMHAHYAIQIGIGSEHGIRFRPDQRVEWTAYGAAIIPDGAFYPTMLVVVASYYVLFAAMGASRSARIHPSPGNDARRMSRPPLEFARARIESTQC